MVNRRYERSSTRGVADPGETRDVKSYTRRKTTSTGRREEMNSF